MRWVRDDACDDVCGSRRMTSLKKVLRRRHHTSALGVYKGARPRRDIGFSCDPNVLDRETSRLVETSRRRVTRERTESRLLARALDPILACAPLMRPTDTECVQGSERRFGVCEVRVGRPGCGIRLRSMIIALTTLSGLQSERAWGAVNSSPSARSSNHPPVKTSELTLRARFPKRPQAAMHRSS